ncbi:MAG: hypothetical protein N3E47_04545 [Candidatus Bathyarchaeota archaeon]|nr:hypothetical protein [Candidatus Bathyarchaeota archaeon]
MLREDVERRVLRVLINIGLIFLVTLTLGFLNISFPSITAIVPSGGFTLAAAVALIAVIILFFIALRIILDLIRLIDMASETILKRIPGFNPAKSPSIIRALKELLAIFIVAIAASISSPLISSVPEVGGWLSIALSIAAFAFSLVLAYDAGRTIYAAFESSIQLLIDRIIMHSNDGEEKDKESIREQ